MAPATRSRRNHDGWRRPGPLAGIPKLRLVIIVPCALAAAWLTVAVGAAGAMRADRPDFALRLAPFDAGARVRSEELRLSQGRPTRAKIAAAGQAAREALQRDPTLVSAWRLLAAEASTQRRDRQASRLLHWAERLSRRDLPTQLGLIEESVARNDIPGALVHYDIALRTSTASSEMLFPVLVRATGEASVIGPLATILNRNPPWRTNFLWAFVSGAPSDETLIRTFELIARQDQPLDEPLAQALIQRLVGRSKFAEAWRAFRLTGGGRGAVPGLRNGGFEADNPVPPFDWQLGADANLRAEATHLETRPGQVLALHAGQGQNGAVARQLIVLTPGQYSLSAFAGAMPEVAPGTVSVAISCAAPGSPSLLASTLPALENRGREHRADFQVPANCPAQWLSIGISAPNSDGEGWMDALTISRQ